MLSEKQILLKKQPGDYNLVAQMMSKTGGYVSPGNVAKLIKRKNAKRHSIAMATLRTVVETRERMLEMELNQ